MESQITPQRIANSIGLDTSFTGTYILVEGKKDIRLFGKFIDPNSCKIKPTFGKYKMRDVYSILTSRDFLNKVGIRDADFLRVEGNEKYDFNYSDHIYPTDCHDSEGMIVNTDAFYDFINTLVSSQNIEKFQSKYGSIRELIYSLSYGIGCLRLANKKHQLGLSFKPKCVDGNDFRYKKFICDRTFKFQGDEKLINTISEYSSNRGNEIKSRHEINEKLKQVYTEQHPLKEIVNGHDLTQILLIVLKKGLKCASKTLQDSDCVEEMLALTYNINYFSETNLYRDLLCWQKSFGKQLIKVA